MEALYNMSLAHPSN